jgi:hypothetical protein
VHDRTDGRLEDVGHRGAVRRRRRLRKFCRVETVVGPRTNVGAGQNYYHNSLKALKRVNKMMTKMALSRPRRVAK